MRDTLSECVFALELELELGLGLGHSHDMNVENKCIRLEFPENEIRLFQSHKVSLWCQF